MVNWHLVLLKVLRKSGLGLFSSVVFPVSMKLARILHEDLMQAVELSARPAFRSLKCRCLDARWCKFLQQSMEGLSREAVDPGKKVNCPSRRHLVIVKKLQRG